MDLTDFECFGLNMPLPNIANTFTGRLIIAASGRCVWSDLEKAGRKNNDDELPHMMCVNDMIMYYPGQIMHAYSNNHKYLPRWIEARRDQFVTRWGNPRYVHSCRNGAKYNWPWPGHGTSSLNAVYTALALGYEEIWLCGVPLDDTGHFFEPPWVKSNFVHEVADRDGEIKYWGSAAKRLFKGRVKSFSGRTRDLLGEPC